MGGEIKDNLGGRGCPSGLIVPVNLGFYLQCDGKKSEGSA